MVEGQTAGRDGGEKLFGAAEIEPGEAAYRRSLVATGQHGDERLQVGPDSAGAVGEAFSREVVEAAADADFTVVEPALRAAAPAVERPGNTCAVPADCRPAGVASG